jgi:hypothetical protein
MFVARPAGTRPTASLVLSISTPGKSALHKLEQDRVTDRLPDWRRPCTDGELAIAGVNTARRLIIKAGGINDRQMLRVEEQLCGLPDGVKRIVVTPQPMYEPTSVQRFDQRPNG